MEASCAWSCNRIAQQDEEKEINLCLRVIKTVNFKINKSETVGKVKTLLCGKEGIPECLQELFLNGNHLKNEKSKLVDYGIHGNSTLNAYVANCVPLKLTIKIPSTNRTIVVEAKAEDTIQNVRALIQAKENIPWDQYNLFYAGKQVEDDKTLSFLDVSGGSTLFVVFNPTDTVQVSVKMLRGETVKAQVKKLYSIRDVKAVLESTVGYPVKALSYGGKVLEDSETVSHYSIQDSSILEMIPLTQIFVKWCGKSTTFEVNLGCPVQKLKEKIHLKLGIPVRVQRLVFEGKTLDDCQDLGSYRVEKDSNIILGLQPHKSALKMKLSSIAISNLDLLGCRTVDSLKRLIARKLGRSVLELHLNGEVLTHSLSPVDDYAMNKGTELDIVI